MIDLAELKKTLCTAFCGNVGIRSSGDLVAVSLPMTARDGDAFSVYLSRTKSGWRLSDAASTMMRLSYENDLNKLLSGPKGRLYDTILAESGLKEDDGEIYTEVPADQLIAGLFRVGQGLSRIEDIALGRAVAWNRRSTAICAPPSMAWCHPMKSLRPTSLEFEGGEDYQVDYRIEAPTRPLFVFGVNGKDKARLTTITLLKLKAAGTRFDSMIVCNDIADLPRADESRLLAAANDVVPSISNVVAIREKIEHRRA